jgi:hypothetical protein
MPDKKKICTRVLGVICRRLVWVCVILCLLVSMELIWGQMNAEPEKAFRLTIKYQNGTFELLGVKELKMVIPVTVKEQILEENKNPTGYSYELLNDEKRVELRSNMPDPLLTFLEYEDPEHPGQLKGQYVEHAEIVFSVIVPATVDTRFVHFTRPAKGYKMVSADKQRREDLGLFDLKAKGGVK